MAESIYTSTSLDADILTTKMPLSDAFNRAQAANARHGIHHGFTIRWDDSKWPLRNYATRYIRVVQGKASVAATQNTVAAAVDNVIASVELTADVIIDLEALTTPIVSSDANLYYIVLRVVYTASTVNNTTGLVSNAGQSIPQFVFNLVSADSGWSIGKGIVLGKFCRQKYYLESFSNNVLTPSRLATSESLGGADMPAVEVDSATWLASFRYQLYLDYHNLHKHVRLKNIPNAAVINSAVMPLADITNSVATTAGAINGWKMAVDWLASSGTPAYITGGIWKDVENFELFDSYFKDNVQLAFHRTPGHNKAANQATVVPGDLVDETVIRSWTDFGMKSMTLDFKGSVFEGNLALDLVLDFTGNTYETGPFHLTIKNLRVKGTVTVNYGQSWLAMAGGAQGTIDFVNCIVYGDFQVRPWPQIKGVTVDAAVTPGHATNPFPAWCNSVSMYLNNAGNIVFSGFTGGTGTTGPELLNKWRRDTTAGTPAYTKGPLIMCYLHNALAGSGAFAMGNPWLVEGAEGGISFEGCIVPQINLLGEAFYAITGMYAPLEQVRVKLVKCAWVKTRPSGIADYWNLISKPVIRIASDDIYTLYDYQNESYKSMNALVVNSDTTIAGVTGIFDENVTAGLDLIALQDVIVNRYLDLGVTGKLLSNYVNLHDPVGHDTEVSAVDENRIVFKLNVHLTKAGVYVYKLMTGLTGQAGLFIKAGLVYTSAYPGLGSTVAHAIGNIVLPSSGYYSLLKFSSDVDANGGRSYVAGAVNWYTAASLFGDLYLESNGDLLFKTMAGIPIGWHAMITMEIDR